jgi:hypothetical protein
MVRVDLEKLSIALKVVQIDIQPQIGSKSLEKFQAFSMRQKVSIYDFSSIQDAINELALQFKLEIK